MAFKVPLLWVMNDSYFACMQGQKTCLLSYNMHLFLRLPNDSFFQTPTLRDANLRWLVDFI